MEEVVAAPADEGQRLDRFLAGAIGGTVSRSRIKALIEAGRVTVNGTTVREPKMRVRCGDRARLDLPPPDDPVPAGEPLPLAILHEDDALIVLDKPAGLVVHPGAGNPSGTLVNALIHHCGASLSGIGGVRRPGIVHRLDKDTSGVMVVAKTDAAHRHLSAQFADHGRTGVLRRTYRALVWGVPEPRGTIDTFLGRAAADRLKKAVVAESQADARRAITHYAVTERFGPPPAPLASLIECRLETGRTHQIRVHMAHAGHPLLGDALYGAGFASKAATLPAPARDALAELGRQALHAASLAFAHPSDGRTMAFDAPMPPDMATLRSRLREA